MACYSVNLPLTAKPKSPANSAGVYLPSTSQLAISGVSISSRETVSYRLRNSRRASPVVVVSSSSYVVNKLDPLKVMISGAPASGKGTQCELITKKMVKDRLSQPDSQQNGWLLDGYPRSLSQATALQAYGFHPDLFIVLEVPEDILVERVIGRRLDPVTGKIYHLKYSPPESDEIAARLTQRFDDTEAKVKLRLQTHNQNVESVLSMYEDITIKVDGSLPMKDVFVRIDNALTKLLEQKKELPRASTIAT
ncbi:adenylate kinase 2, chloroplastic isoform X4 [Impatiens glandulifera]|uniref:adenylate kinase 2, chloroplastic isoform X4 n=1 Tax=Impatiens glandulifera TaxID=253017 RepID=UPI001FB13A23|nr:adenylate kinase 2, chloroplastic isoform X4 [Impatiens glandulifera]